MSNSKIHSISSQLCETLGVKSSAENIDKVADLLTELVKEVMQENTNTYNKVVEKCCEQDDAALVKQITDNINRQHESIVANLTALR